MTIDNRFPLFSSYAKGERNTPSGPAALNHRTQEGLIPLIPRLPPINRAASPHCSAQGKPLSHFSFRAPIAILVEEFDQLGRLCFAELPRKTGLACRELIEMTFLQHAGFAPALL
jgi:hypothetical protein